MTKTQILGKFKRRDGCSNREEAAPAMHDDDYDWADDETLNYEETMKIIDGLGPDVEVTGPPARTLMSEEFRPAAVLTSAYVAKTTTYAPPPAVAVAVDPTFCPTG
jgi:hypothetical protein